MGRKPIPAKIKFDMDLVKMMPPLHHTLPGEEYAPEKSEVLHWIAGHHEFLQMIFNGMRNSGYIEYDPLSMTWKGVDCGE